MSNTSVPQVTPIRERLVSLLEELRKAKAENDFSCVRGIAAKIRTLHDGEVRRAVDHGRLSPEAYQFIGSLLAKAERGLEELDALDKRSRT